jgi:hypothetical protein
MWSKHLIVQVILLIFITFIFGGCVSNSIENPKNTSTLTPTPTIKSTPTSTQTPTTDAIGQALTKASETGDKAFTQRYKCNNLTNSRYNLTNPADIKAWYAENRPEFIKYMEYCQDATDSYNETLVYLDPSDPYSLYWIMQGTASHLQKDLQLTLFSYNNDVAIFNRDYGAQYGYIETI